MKARAATAYAGTGAPRVSLHTKLIELLGRGGVFRKNPLELLR